MLSKIRGREGFTLVELMMVVAIIGILAAVAIPNFLKFRLQAKTAEAKTNLDSIRSCEVAYFAEWDSFVGNITATPIPDRTHSPGKVAWIRGTRFEVIGYSADAMVFYSYEVNGTDFPAHFTASASADLDDDGSWSAYSFHDTSIQIVKSGPGLF